MKKKLLILIIFLLCGCTNNTANNEKKYLKAEKYALQGEFDKAIEIYEELGNYADSGSIATYLSKFKDIDFTILKNPQSDEEINDIYSSISAMQTNNDVENKIFEKFADDCIKSGIDFWIDKIFEDIDNKNGVSTFHDQPFYDPSKRYDPVNNVAFKEFYYWFGNDSAVCEWGNSYGNTVDYAIFECFDENYSYMYLDLFQDGSKPADEKFENLYSILCYYQGTVRYPMYTDNYKTKTSLYKVDPEYDGPRSDEVKNYIINYQDIGSLEKWKEGHNHEVIKEYTFDTEKNIIKLKEIAQDKSNKKQKEIEKQKEKEEQEKEKNFYSPEIGMTKEEVLDSIWGHPDKKNVDDYAWGTSEQWVYKNHGYIYFENGIVTSIQRR